MHLTTNILISLTRCTIFLNRTDADGFSQEDAILFPPSRTVNVNVNLLTVCSTWKIHIDIRETA